jgi:GH18 family chitinase
MKKIIITSLLLTLLMPTMQANAATKPLNTKQNKAACISIKKNYKLDVISKWSAGTANDNDLINEIDANIKMLSLKQKPTSGKIKTSIGSWITSEKNTKIAVTDKDLEAITAAMSLKISSITNFDKLCKSIEK